jgi:hypothetical protein
MVNPTFSTWNPLEFLAGEDQESFIDPSEIRQIGIRTAEIASDNGQELLGGEQITGREVGDDRVDMSRTPDSLCCALAVQESVTHMVTSNQDTFVGKRAWNFCEVTSGPLTDPSEGFDHVRKDGDFSRLGFNDSIVLRIILDVQKGDGEEHSSSEPGKMSMLGSRLATPRRENRGTWMLASMFQDAMLCTHKASEPKYLPQVMGGTGVTALFDNADNIFLSVLAYKGGTYRRIYATAIAEMQEYLRSLERGVQSAPVLSPRLRDKQEYFWGTYENLVFVPDPNLVNTSEDPPAPLYKMTGGQNRYQNFENRLLRTRHVVTRKRALVEWSHTRRLQRIFNGVFSSMKEISDYDRDRSSMSRARYQGALNANSALVNLLRREANHLDAQKMMGDKNFTTLTVGKRDITRYDTEWVYRNGQGEVYSLRDVLLSEDIFVREEVSEEETFKVGGITLRPYQLGGPKPVPTKTKVGLYRINKSMEEWSEDLLRRLISKRTALGRPLTNQEIEPICNEDREWVNDDSGLIGRCHNEVSGAKALQTVALVSGDRRLANQMAETCNVTVLRVDPAQYAVRQITAGLEPADETRTTLEKGGMMGFEALYVDTGSVSAHAASMAEEGGILYTRHLRDTGWSGDRRYTSYTLRKLDVPRRIRFEVHRPVIRPKVWRSTSRSHSSVYSSHSSWRRSDRDPTSPGSSPRKLLIPGR